MQTIRPMDRFMNAYGSSLDRSEKMAEEMNPANPSDAMEYTKSMIEVKLMGNAVSSAMDARYGLLKKIMSSIK
jgi:hypothetical protein